MKICNLSEIRSGESKFNKGTIHKSNGKTVVVLNLVAGKEIPEHTADVDVILQVIEGKIDFNLKGNHHILEEGDLFFFGAEEKHSLKGIENSKILLIK